MNENKTEKGGLENEWKHEHDLIYVNGALPLKRVEKKEDTDKSKNTYLNIFIYLYFHTKHIS